MTDRENVYPEVNWDHIESVDVQLEVDVPLSTEDWDRFQQEEALRDYAAERILNRPPVGLRDGRMDRRLVPDHPAQPVKCNRLSSRGTAIKLLTP